MSPFSDRLVAGLIADRYLIKGLIASGGMGSVYCAHDTVLDRTVALKVLGAGTGDDDFVARFRAEATNAARLSHPNIVQVFDFGYADGTTYMAMEYVEGQTLRDVMREHGVVAPATATSIAAQVASALEHARRAGIVHRDVKPENILITTDGRVKVADFGLSRALAASSATRADVVLGTPHYLSPEQVQGESADHRSDVYALGVVLYEMLTGRTPFHADSPIAIAYQRVTNDVPRPGSLNPSVPPMLDDIVERATARDPSQRYATAGAMASALRECAGADQTTDVGHLVHHTTALSLDAQQTVAIPKPAPRTTARRTVRRRRIVAVATALVVLGSILAATTLRTTEVPGLVGLTQEEAKGVLESSGLKADVTLANHAEVPAGSVVAQEPSAGTSLRRGKAVKLIVSLGPELLTLPDVRGILFADAEEQLRARGFAEIERIDEFSSDVERLAVIAQSPEPGLLVAKDSTVTLRVSKGPEIVRVPDVVGDPESSAVQDLRAAGLEPAIERVETLQAPAGQVLAQDPKPGRNVERGSTVKLTIAKSPPSKPVPDLRCMTRRQAQDALGETGFKPKFEGKGSRVVDQTPGPNERAPKGSTVTVYLGFGSFC